MSLSEYTLSGSNAPVPQLSLMAVSEEQELDVTDSHETGCETRKDAPHPSGKSQPQQHSTMCVVS